jgi:[acyl-carrier-protein] S-malonyltransferase
MSTFDGAVREDAVVLFPGQGSLSGGAGTPWTSTPSWSIVQDISDITGVDVSHLLLDASDEDVVRTDRAQLATFAISLVSWYELQRRDLTPAYFLGHSLGEFSVLVATGILSVHDGALLVHARGTAMKDAAQQSSGSMTALMGGDDDARLALAGLEEIWIANINGPGQIVVSGSTEALAQLNENYRTLGWRRATPLPVGGAFHSPLMAPAQEQLDTALASVTWGTTDKFPISNVDGKIHQDGATWHQLLARQMTAPVEFLSAVSTLPASVTTTIEVAPGAVLSGLTKRIRTFDRQIVFSSPDLSLEEIV